MKVRVVSYEMVVGAVQALLRRIEEAAYEIDTSALEVREEPGEHTFEDALRILEEGPSNPEEEKLLARIRRSLREGPLWEELQESFVRATGIQKRLL